MLGERLQQTFRRNVSVGDWQFVSRAPQQTHGPNKPGLASQTASSTAILQLDYAPTGLVVLGFLRSDDERMGALRVRCAQGCNCRPSVHSGWHTQRSSVMALAVINVSTNSIPSTAIGSRACILELQHVARRAHEQVSRFMLFAVIVAPHITASSNKRVLEDMRKGLAKT